jgi:hypothetical protein
MKETLMYVKWNDMSIREKGLPSCGTSTIGLKILIFNGGFFNCSLHYPHIWIWIWIWIWISIDVSPPFESNNKKKSNY